MNTAARVITKTGKFCHYTMHQELHWFDVTERIQFRVAARPTVYRCLRNMAPRYLTEMCMPIGMSARRQGLRSATTSDLVIQRVRLATYYSRAFSLAGPVCWNGLADYLKSHIRSVIVLNDNSRHFYAVLCYSSVRDFRRYAPQM